MRTMIVGPKSSYVGKKCKLCPRKIRGRQSVIVDTVPGVIGSAATRLYHVSCMAALVAGAPVGIDEFEAHRDRIMATNNPYAA